MKGKTYMTEDWRPSISCITKARARYPRMDIEYYIEECRDHFLGNGKPMKSWDATFRNWLRRAGNFGEVKKVPLQVVGNKPQRDVIDIILIRQARGRGIATEGLTETQINNAIYEYDQRQRAAGQAEQNRAKDSGAQGRQRKPATESERKIAEQLSGLSNLVGRNAS